MPICHQINANVQLIGEFVRVLMNKSRVRSEQTTRQTYFEDPLLIISCSLFSSGSVSESLKCNVHGGLAGASEWIAVNTSHFFVHILETVSMALQSTRSEIVNDVRD
jgi:hypothetical protein